MSLYIASLNSGSNGNCYYVGNDQDAVLIDAGISCREIMKRLERLSIPIQRIKALFISHEHSDHIRGLSQLTRKCGIPVYITEATCKQLPLPVDEKLLRTLNTEQSINVGNISVTSFPKFHDAAEPCSFVVECNGVRVGVFTDIGHPCQRLVQYFSSCDAAFLESNYDEQMLSNGSYPFHLKKRIRSGFGHLSNTQALELFVKHRSSKLSHLVLAHLSENNNCPNLVQQMFQQHAGNTQIVVASRINESQLYHITSSAPAVKLKSHKNSQQLTLSF